MARNYILGGMAGTQLQAGKPYFKRIVRVGGTQGLNRDDDLTVRLSADGEILAKEKSNNWDARVAGATGAGSAGELLMIEFPTTMRSVEVNIEEAWVSTGANAAALDNGRIRCKVMLTAEWFGIKQKTHFFNEDGTEDLNSPEASPVTNGNYIEIRKGETATINSRTKVIFVLIQKFSDENVIDPVTGGLVGGTGSTGNAAIDPVVPDDGAATDAISILITGVLDHEPTSGGSQAANEPNSKIIDNGDTRTLRKIWGASDGIG